VRAIAEVLDETALAGMKLVGGRDGGFADSELEQRSTLLFEVVRRIVAQCAQPPDPIPDHVYHA
jgi:hypothetical protein